MILSDRKSKILEFLIRQYIKNAEPISSEKLAQYFDYRISPATIRLDLAELESEGYLSHPHTSAGRVPTEKGYKFYIENFISKSEPNWEPEQDLYSRLEDAYHNDQVFAQLLAKTIASITGEAAVVVIDQQNIFMNGLANLFAKPEFRDYDYVVNLSRTFDRMDALVEDVFSSLSGDLNISLGKNNPFDNNCGSILMRINFSPRQTGLLGIIGPMRMDYARNVAVMRAIQEIIKDFSR